MSVETVLTKNLKWTFCITHLFVSFFVLRKAKTESQECQNYVLYFHCLLGLFPRKKKDFRKSANNFFGMKNIFLCLKVKTMKLFFETITKGGNRFWIRVVSVELILL